MTQDWSTESQRRTKLANNEHIQMLLWQLWSMWLKNVVYIMWSKLNQ